MGEIVVFSKSRCPHCVDAKALLTDLDIPYTDIDIEGDVESSMLMSLISQRHTVPQIFFNEDHVGGADELRQLSPDQIRSRAKAALAEPNGPAFRETTYNRDQLEAAIVPIKDILEPHLPDDPTTVPEYSTVRIWYRTMFGFLCNCYDQMVLRPEPMALFIGALSSAMRMVADRTGVNFGMSCLATAYAANCSYCSAHGADLSMKYGGKTPEHVQALFEFLRGKADLDDLPFDDSLKSIINLSAGMTTQSITAEDVERARTAFGIEHLSEVARSVGGMGLIMGFLNRWNDLIGVEIEASIKQTIDGSSLSNDWDWGTHDTEDGMNRHDYRNEQPPLDGPPTREQFIELTNQVLEAVNADLAPLHRKYAAFDQRLLPAWIGSFSEAHASRATAALYHAAFNDGTLDSSIKHLAAFALAAGTNQTGIRDEERRIARLVANDRERIDQRLAAAEQFGQTGRFDDAVLDESERAALKLARVSQTFPHIVRGQLVKELAEALSPEQIVELVVSLAVIGMGQRWTTVQRAFAEFALE